MRFTFPVFAARRTTKYLHRGNGVLNHSGGHSDMKLNQEPTVFSLNFSLHTQLVSRMIRLSGTGVSSALDPRVFHFSLYLRKWQVSFKRTRGWLLGCPLVSTVRWICALSVRLPYRSVTVCIWIIPLPMSPVLVS